MTDKEVMRWLTALPPQSRDGFLDGLEEEERARLMAHWPFWARTEQLPPPGDWRIWLICAGRGFGKTRAGAEWIGATARANPQARIALVGSSIGEARSVMVEGESGILSCSRGDWRPLFEASLRRLTWPNGAQAHLYSAAEPESLRGPQHSHGRRAGAEGILCERGTRPNRHASSSSDRGRKRRPSAGPRRRRNVVGGDGAERRMDWPSKPNRLLPDGQLDLRDPDGRFLPFRQVKRAGAPACRGMAIGLFRDGAERWRRCR